MFDLISGGERHTFHDQTAAPVVISVIGHAVVVAAVVVLPLLFATSRLPIVPTMMAFVAAPPAPPPPSPPRPPAPAAGRPAPARVEKPLVAPVSPNAAPLEAPATVLPEPPMQVSRGGEGGVEGGIEGGVAGGIVGGLFAAPPPPPPPPAAPPPPAPTQPVRVGGQIQVPKLVKRVEPIYPDFAIAADVTGMVILEAIVDGSGSVQSVRVLRSVKVLDTAAVDAVKQWRYEPLVLNGVTTPFILTVTLTFAIK